MKKIFYLLLLAMPMFVTTYVSAQDESSLKQQAVSGKPEAQRKLGIFYYEKENPSEKDKQQAVLWLEKAATNGDIVAQNYMGYVYITGFSVKEDKEKSIEWYKKSAIRGYPLSQYSLSVIFEKEDDYIESNYWLTQAARRGDPKSQVKLALRYRTGTGTDDTGRLRSDSTQLFFWAYKAALADYGSAQFFIGDMYETGDGIPQNNVLAGTWLTLAAEKDPSDTFFSSRKNSVIKSLTTEQKKEVARLVEHYKKTIENNEPLIVKRLNKLTPITDPSPQDNFTNTLEKAKNGDSKAMVRIGLIYGNGTGVKQNHAEALKWFSLAADKNNPEAQYYLAYAYKRGVGVEIDENKSEEYFSLAAKGGEKFSLNYMGIRYRDGQGVPQNLPLAFSYFQRSALLGVANAQKSLAECYLKGDGVEPDLRMAYVWFSLSSAFGEDSAISQRDEIAHKLPPQTLVQAQEEAQKRFQQIFKGEADI